MCTQLSATQDRLPSVHAANLDDLQQHTTTQFMTQTHNNAVHDTDAQQHSSWHIRTTTQFNGPDHPPHLLEGCAVGLAPYKAERVMQSDIL